MDIISIYFPLLVIIAAFVFYLLNPKYRIILLVCLSAGFISIFSLNLLLYVLIYSIVNYFIGLKIPGSRFRKSLFRGGIILNLLQIILLRYADFTIDKVFHMFNLNLNITRLSEIIIPVGISYFTLQGIGYIINIYMGWEKPERKFVNFLLYILFFPKFLSGPIERSNHFLPQLKILEPFSGNNVIEGLKIAFWGFFKKVIIANNLAGSISQIHSNTETISGLYVLIVVLIQPLYLYFDFSGYTDIAIGFAKTFGIDLLPNFNKPFLSENMTTFWKRFHISLSSWFNDYIFKQASFRFRKLKSYASVIAVFITWVLFGIWHGAGWNFMVLGLVQAMAIVYEFYTRKQRAILFSKLPGLLKVWAGRTFTYLFFGWALTFFFSQDLSSTINLFSKIRSMSFSPQSNILLVPLLFGLFFALALLAYEILQNDYPESFNKLHNYWKDHKVFRILFYYAVTILIISQLGGNSSFVYQMF